MPKTKMSRSVEQLAKKPPTPEAMLAFVTASDQYFGYMAANAPYTDPEYDDDPHQVEINSRAEQLYIAYVNARIAL
jgi:hypothetical protein